MSYNDSYPKEPIGGGNPYWQCAHCKISDPQINGDVSNHMSWCTWRIAQQGGKITKTFIFALEGLEPDREESAQGVTEQEAWSKVWAELTDDERNSLTSHECVEEY